MNYRLGLLVGSGILVLLLQCLKTLSFHLLQLDEVMADLRHGPWHHRDTSLLLLLKLLDANRKRDIYETWWRISAFWTHLNGQFVEQVALLLLSVAEVAEVSLSSNGGLNRELSRISFQRLKGIARFLQPHTLSFSYFCDQPAWAAVGFARSLICWSVDNGSFVHDCGTFSSSNLPLNHYFSTFNLGFSIHHLWLSTRNLCFATLNLLLFCLLDMLNL